MSRVDDEILLTGRQVEAWKTERAALTERLKRLDRRLALIAEISAEIEEAAAKIAVGPPQAGVPQMVSELEVALGVAALTAEEPAARPAVVLREPSFGAPRGFFPSIAN